MTPTAGPREEGEQMRDGGGQSKRRLSSLTAAMSTKIWQKITIINRL
jgi:hypothetical protein